MSSAFVCCRCDAQFGWVAYLYFFSAYIILHYTFGVGLGGGVSCANNVLALAYLLCFYTTSSYVKISLSWCYVTRTSLDLMLRYVASLVLLIQLPAPSRYHLVDATRTYLDFMLRYVAFSCASYTTSSYVKISLRTWKVGNERSHDWKAHGPKSIILETQFFSRPGINCHVSTQWNCEIQSLKPCNLHMKWNMEHVHKGKKSTKCCKGLRNDSWDASQNSQKQWDRCSGRDLVFTAHV